MMDVLNFGWSILGSAVAGIVMVALMRQSIATLGADLLAACKRCDSREERLRQVENDLGSIKTNLSWIRTKMEQNQK